MSDLLGVVAESFHVTSATRQDSTVVTVTEPAADGEEPALLPTEQLATYLYEDVHQVLRRASFDLSRELGAPPEYADDAELFVRLFCSDMERLWQHQLMTGLALLVTVPIERLGATHTVLYRAIYRLRQSLDAEQGSVRLRPVQRAAEGVDAQVGIPGARAFLIAEWTRDTTLRRVSARPPRYYFHWWPSQPAILDDVALPPAMRYDALAPMVGDLRVLQIVAE
jgi:hypothetical protein